jgi:uncharacterized membrane protein
LGHVDVAMNPPMLVAVVVVTGTVVVVALAEVVVMEDVTLDELQAEATSASPTTAVIIAMRVVPTVLTIVASCSLPRGSSGVECDHRSAGG